MKKMGGDLVSFDRKKEGMGPEYGHIMYVRCYAKHLRHETLQ